MYFSSSSSEAAINNLRVIDELMKSNGNVKVGDNWELPDKTNATRPQPSTTNAAPGMTTNSP
jgi:hypothetical protein